MFKKKQTITMDELNNMTEEDLRTLNEKLAKKLLKEIAVVTAVSAVAYVAIVKWADSLENDDTNE